MKERVFNPAKLRGARYPAYSQSTLAAEIQHRTRDWSRPLSTSQSMVCEWENGKNGKNAPEERTVRVIAEITGQSIDFFYSSGAEEEDDEEAALPTTDDLIRALAPLFVQDRDRSVAA